jgi:hypothetical protein
MHVHLSILSLVSIFASIAFGYPKPTYPPDAVDGLAAQGLLKLAAYEAKHKSNSSCTLANAVKRREWLVNQDLWV